MDCAQLPYSLAPGHNNAAGLTVIEGLAPFGGLDFKTFRGWAQYDPGQFIIRGDGSLYISGYPSTQWDFAWISNDQLYYFMTNYGNAGYSGQVTVATASDIPDTLTVYNAIMTIDKLPNQNPYFGQYLGANIRFTRMVAIETPLLQVESGIGLQFINGDQWMLVNTP